MKKEEYEALLSVGEHRHVSVSEFFSHDRTLLYGYDLSRNTWHIYTKNSVIHKYVYNYKKEKISIESATSFDIRSLIPDKRLYPEACDSEFCAVLLKKGVYLPFTAWGDRPVAKYYGEVYDQ